MLISHGYSSNLRSELQTSAMCLKRLLKHSVFPTSVLNFWLLTEVVPLQLVTANSNHSHGATTAFIPIAMGLPWQLSLLLWYYGSNRDTTTILIPCQSLSLTAKPVEPTVEPRLIVGAKKQDHIKHILRDRLHWLPVPQRVQFKLCMLTYKALHGLAPSYIADLCRPVTTVGNRQRLRSATRDDLVVASSVTNFGTRAFAVAGPKAWNQLPMQYEHGSQ